jgi:hypothetical protein
MDSPRDQGAPQSRLQIEAFLTTLRRSAEIAQELLRTATQQSERIRSLDGDLISAQSRIGFLEKEVGQLRDSLGPLAPGLADQAALEALLEDQNCLAQLFVTSDRLAGVRSVPEAIDVAVEVLHNLVGAHRYGVYVCLERDDEPWLVAPGEQRYRQGIEEHRDVVLRTLKADNRRTSLDPKTTSPLCVPLRFEDRTLGAIMIAEFVPQVGPQLGRLQIDLLSLLSDRLASSMCVGTLHQNAREQGQPWAAARDSLARMSERLR